MKSLTRVLGAFVLLTAIGSLFGSCYEDKKVELGTRYEKVIKRGVTKQGHPYTLYTFKEIAESYEDKR